MAQSHQQPPYQGYRANPSENQSQDNPLDLDDYVMGTSSRPAQSEHLLRGPQSPMVALGNASATLASFPELTHLAFTASPGMYNRIPHPYGRGQILSPKVDTSFAAVRHRGSISSASDVHDTLRQPLSASPIVPPQPFGRGGIANSRNANAMNDGAMSATSAGLTSISQRKEATLSSQTGDAASPEDQTDTAESKKDDKADPPPPWSEMKTKAGKERKRLPLACIACRRKKIRCSGEKPACKHCLRSRIPCVYKVTTRKAAPRTDYMAMLDKRLKRMEDRVIKLIPKPNQANIGGIARAIVKPALPPPPLKTSTGKKRGADEAFGEVPDLDEWSKRPNAEGTEEAETAFRTTDAEDKRLLTEGAEFLPSKEIQFHLAETYFDYVYGQAYHLLHKPSFMRRLEAGAIPPVLMLAVCAISARFSTHPLLRTEPAFLRGDEWAAAARDISLRRYDTPNITILIVYVLLGLHEFGTCQGGRSWMFGGMAARMAYSLQLHKDLEYDPTARRRDNPEAKLSFTDREIRRRTMWACFLMDRFNSSGTGRPMFINDSVIETPLPVKENYFQMEIPAQTEHLSGSLSGSTSADTAQTTNPEQNMGVSAYTIRVIYNWGRIVRYLNMGGEKKDPHPKWKPESKFHSLKKAVQEFQENLPEHLRYTPDNLQNHLSERTANQFLFMHIAYNQTVLFLNHWAIPSFANGYARPPQNMPHQFIQEARRSALDAANTISTVIKEAFEHNVVAPFAGYCAFFSSTVHVAGIFSSNPTAQATAKQNLAINVKYLSKMKKYWGMFHFVSENLKELYRVHADASLRGENAEGGGRKNSSIFQYGDWFDRYPHGVSQIDYEDPATEVKQEAGGDAVLGQKSDLQSVEEFFASLSPVSREQHKRKMAKKGKQQGKIVPQVKPAVAAAEAAQAIQNRRINTQQRQQQNSPVTVPSSALPVGQPQQRQQQPTVQQHMFIPPQPQQQTQLPSPLSYNPDPNLQLLLQQQSQMPQAHDFLYGMDTGSATDMWPGMDLTSGANAFFEGGVNWFMPFNLDPPTVGDDAFSAANHFGGFGFGGHVEGGHGTGEGDGGAGGSQH